jgi:hypothetical protein
MLWVEFLLALLQLMQAVLERQVPNLNYMEN